ncbi:ATP12 family protein [Ascidiaceihabitans sp.]|uniref:ATP12 family chaperone protein n=1 Tax=Ascidiaceihabitans sp. TaxID=1872644 RepID=UPI0032973B42
MSDWAPKRFWTNADVQEVDGGFAVELDGRPVKTPAKAALHVPTQAMAQAIAAEWDAQLEKVDPNTMPFTRSANAAIDKVRVQHAEVADMLAAYGDSDLLCYRAQSPAELVARQEAAWDPVLNWSETFLNAKLEPRTGVIHVPQDPASLATLNDRTHALNAFELAGFHDLVSMSGSLILGFAAAYDHMPSEDIWTMSRLDELWQEEQWGEDDEAQALIAVKQTAFMHAKRFFDASRAG